MLGDSKFAGTAWNNFRQQYRQEKDENDKSERRHKPKKILKVTYIGTIFPRIYRLKRHCKPLWSSLFKANTRASIDIHILHQRPTPADRHHHSLWIFNWISRMDFLCVQIVSIQLRIKLRCKWDVCLNLWNIEKENRNISNQPHPPPHSLFLIFSPPRTPHLTISVIPTKSEANIDWLFPVSFRTIIGICSSFSCVQIIHFYLF